MTRTIVNRLPGNCANCGQHIPIAGGLAVNDGTGWVVRHDGDCPANPHNPNSAPTWRISLGEGYGGSPFTPGSTFRWTWPTDNPDPATVPGGRLEPRGLSGIVTAVTGGLHYYREDGMSFGVGDEAGHVYWADVRIASDEEAAPVLEAEATEQRRANLTGRVRDLFAWRYAGTAPDAALPAEVNASALWALPEVPRCTVEERRSQLYSARLLVDVPSGVVWTVTHNGADGDDWSVNNVSGHVALRHPLTEERRQLIADLRGEYEDWTGIPDDAAAIIRAAGHGRLDLAEKLPNVRIDSAADATALVARTPTGWDTAGWRYAGCQSHRWTASQAAQLADAGISARDADERWRAGYTSFTEVLEASAPQLPTTPGRFVLPGFPGWHTIVTDHPAHAQERIARQVAAWKTWQHHPDVTCVYAASEWQLWSDGGITRAWYRLPEGTQAPQNLAPPAAELLALVAMAVNVKEYPRELRARFATATGHTATTITEHKDDGSGSWAGAKLVRHDGTLADDTTVTVWEVAAYAGGWGGEDADHDEWHSVFVDEQAARARYREESSRG